MPIIHADYHPSLLLRNPHVNTFYPYLFRKIGKPYQRRRIKTYDGDFFDVDAIKKGSKNLAILLHGLEGSSFSQYILGTSQMLSEHNWDVACINFRSCSGQLNDTMTLYHSGFTLDVHQYVQENLSPYENVVLVGFSLGGNVVLKYTTDEKFSVSHKIKAVIGVSVPCDLKGGSQQIMQPKNFLYQRNFLKSLSQKMIKKAELFPEIGINNLKKVKSLVDFDEYFTGPIHGFAGADDYYAKCSSLATLTNAKIPTLVINAQDDTFLSATSYPIEIAKNSENVFLLMPKYGGHVGFATFG
ncbi:MAG: alpha/beta fold hydrolase, partial [Saprospiraceae bacterium]